MAYQQSQTGDACGPGSLRAEEHHATSAVALERVWAEANWSARAALGPMGRSAPTTIGVCGSSRSMGTTATSPRMSTTPSSWLWPRAPRRRGQHAPHARRGRGWVAAGQPGLSRTPRPSLARRADRHRLPRRPHLGGAQQPARGQIPRTLLLAAARLVPDPDPRPLAHGPPSPASDPWQRAPPGASSRRRASTGT